MSSAELDTIVAPATPVGRSALAVVRIDGPRAIEILSRLSGVDQWEPRRAVRVELERGMGAIDEAIALFFAGPASYTGNDLVELSLHGSPVTVRRLIDAAIALGARMAEPGEFTERAVLNGKIDLVQAEAVADLIEARTDLQARLSLSNLRGVLSERAEAIRADLLDLISRFEAALDFADEGYEFVERSEAKEVMERARAGVADLLDSAQRGMATNEGLTAVLMGRPNAGKSTLLNALVGSDRAIVTAVAGTTRDLLRETIEVGGLPLTLVDTAGLRETAEEVEEIGIRRTREAAASADLILYLIDAGEGRGNEDDAELRGLDQAMVIYTKRDLSPPPEGSVSVSAKSGDGLREFLEILDRWVEERWRVPEGRAAVVNRRQRDSLAAAGRALALAIEALEGGASEEIVLTDLYVAARSIGELTGAISHQEIIDSIFSRFCIGK